MLKIIKNIPEALQRDIQLKLDKFNAHLPEKASSFTEDKSFQNILKPLFGLSDYAFDWALKYPDWLVTLYEEGLDEPIESNLYSKRLKAILKKCEDSALMMSQVRLFRHYEMIRIMWRFILNKASLEEHLSELSHLADAIILVVYQWCYKALEPMYGIPMYQEKKQDMVIVAMGKLGAGELNFSSDVDLIFCYEHATTTQGGKKQVQTQEFFVLLAQQFIKALAEQTEDGFVYRVDVRLRPHGQSGPLVLSYNALETYYQLHGRDWERYAWIKARPLTGLKRTKKALINLLNPFVYRRYLDFSAFESLRSMKKKVEIEVKKRNLQKNLKLGPGGIRQIEFIAQMFQLIRAGKEPQFKTQKLDLTLTRLMDDKLILKKDGKVLLDAYAFLRKSEHLLQMINDEQTHDLPSRPKDRARLAWLMGFEDYETFLERLTEIRDLVQAQFEQISTPMPKGLDAQDDKAHWSTRLWGELDDASIQKKASKKFDLSDNFFDELRQFKKSKTVQSLQTSARSRLDDFMKNLLNHLFDYPEKEALLASLLKVVRKITRRSSYLLLLNENPAAMNRFVQLCSKSSWVVTQMANFPVLIDELLEPLDESHIQDKEALVAQLNAVMKWIDDDLDAQMEKLRQFKLGYFLRLAICELTTHTPIDIGLHLTYLSEAILEKVYELSCQYAQKKMKAHKDAPQTPFMPALGIIAYGNFGGFDLQYHSDLDLVFIYDDTQISENLSSYQQDAHLRIAQRMIHMLSTQTLSGKLYDIDVRLRPGGSAGLLVTNLKSYAKYLEQDAWTWEHQALVRARMIFGSPQLLEMFSTLRGNVLTQHRPLADLKEEIKNMRLKMTHQKTSRHFHIKHSSGGVTDIEFIVQYYVLAYARAFPQLLNLTKTRSILEALEHFGVLDKHDYEDLVAALECYQRVIRLTILRQDPYIQSRTVEPWPHRVHAIWQALFDDS